MAPEAGPMMQADKTVQKESKKRLKARGEIKVKVETSLIELGCKREYSMLGRKIENNFFFKLEYRWFTSCCINFRYIAKRLFHYRLFQDNEHSFVSYRVSPSCLFYI